MTTKEKLTSLILNDLNIKEKDLRFPSMINEDDFIDYYLVVYEVDNFDYRELYAEFVKKDNNNRLRTLIICYESVVYDPILLKQVEYTISIEIDGKVI